MREILSHRDETRESYTHTQSYRELTDLNVGRGHGRPDNVVHTDAEFHHTMIIHTADEINKRERDTADMSVKRIE
jgi:homogentisate 1,2-dioxygenase